MINFSDTHGMKSVNSLFLIRQNTDMNPDTYFIKYTTIKNKKCKNNKEKILNFFVFVEENQF